MIRRLLLRLTVLAVVLLLTTILGELLARLATGHRVFTFELERVEAEIPAATGEPAADIAAVAAALTTDLAASGKAEAAWIGMQPPKDDAPPADRAAEAAFARFRNVAVCYVFNSKFIESSLRDPRGLSRFLPGGHPDSLAVFDAVDGASAPVYRFPSLAQLPTGLVTNRFGMRGADRPIEKPEGTIRIACLGASTTVCGHGLGWSWPELLEAWLTAWATKHGVPVRFEVINAGREGIKSTDIVAIYEQEVRPLDVDYVFYYEGSNQFHLQDAVRWEGDARYAVPPGAPEGGTTDPTADRTGLVRYSAIASLVKGTLAARRVAAGEPDKPIQEIAWPEGQVEDAPVLDALDGDFLALETILGDLDRLREATAADGTRLVVGSFAWLVGDDVALDPERDRALFDYLIRRFWPIRFELVARLAAFQNRVFEAWCRQHEIAFVDVAGRMPRVPALYVDPIHVNDAGVRARGWIVLEGLLPLIESDLRTGARPRPPRPGPRSHPATTPPRRVSVKGG